MREQVLEARERQQMRCRGAAMRENGRLSPGEILKYCPLGLEEQEFLEQASEQAGLSMRGCHRVIRVARTIADLEGKDRIRHDGKRGVAVPAHERSVSSRSL